MLIDRVSGLLFGVIQMAVDNLRMEGKRRGACLMGDVVLASCPAPFRVDGGRSALLSGPCRESQQDWGDAGG